MSEQGPTEKGSETIRVAIVDDHTILVEALQAIVNSQEDMEAAGTALNCAEALELVTRSQPDVLILDVSLPDGDGIEIITEIQAQSPETNILILSSFDDEATLMRATQAGVVGFVSKSRNMSEVLSTIREAAAGEIAVPPRILLGLLNRTQRDLNTSNHPQIVLTNREREILSLLAQGMGIYQIAEMLSIAPLTVSTHLRNLMQKMKVKSRLQAVSLALRYGWIEPPA